ncbi:hypothetical protein YOLOSWAG_310 [Erwinia phage vB_EamM_Yoloswag]|uniref:Uncharacterized protein n=1 Tax=Erwinia phage vB_EamM_Yoloswag TaxID=1958956 RepID=A0A1S6L3Q7_9CAUD|nr:hypothetical protein HOR66_gp310 [Erwinia phage vB_EamM_Yoloswag]AQT28821.1 hypothetical protein YOLOSWAG_310 [Erwinia phage vB_EamM_Yoloswag]
MPGRRLHPRDWGLAPFLKLILISQFSKGFDTLERIWIYAVFTNCALILNRKGNNNAYITQTSSSR